MKEEKSELEALLLTRLLRLNAAVAGVVTGIMAGGTLFLATLWLVLKGGAVVGPHLALLGQFFPGYRVTIAGSVLGFGYAFVCGFLLGFFVAALYNWLSDLRSNEP